MLALLLLACSEPALDTTACPGLDCVDSITLRAMDPAGVVLAVRGSIGEEATTAVTFDCTTTPSGEGCNSDGSVTVYVYARTVQVNVDNASGTLGYHGELDPMWDAPYDSEACGHYCYESDVDVVLAAN